MKNIFRNKMKNSGFFAITFMLLAMFISCEDEKERPIPPVFDGEVTALYLAGSSTNKLVDFKLGTNDGNIYTYEGVLNTGELYFQTEKDSDINAFGRGEDENSIAMNSSTPFSIAEKGFYNIEINVEEKSIKKVSHPLGDILYMVGPPVDTWAGERAETVNCSDAEPFIYTYAHFFFAGQYKFLLQRDNMLAKFVPDKSSKDIRFYATEEDLIAAGYEAENWNLETEGDYNVTVDLAQKKVTMTPITFYPDNVDRVYIIGNKYGWDMGVGATPLTKGTADGEYYITDDLVAGDFKFLFQKYNYRPALVHKEGSVAELEYMISPDGPTDRKWIITTPGNYTIRINIKNNTISITNNSQGATITALYLAGTSANTLADFQLTTTDENVYTYEGVLNAGNLYFRTAQGNDVNAVGKGANDNTIDLNTTTPFSITDKGFYKITINVENKSINIEMTSTPFGDVLYMIGPPVDTWEGVKGGEVVCSPAEPFVYTYTHYFFAGQYKFLLQTDNQGAKIVPDKITKDIKFFPTEATLVAAGYDAENWNLETAGDYTVKVDLAQKKVTLTSTTFYPDNVDNIYIIGNKYGWNASEAAPLTKGATDGEYYITDDLTTGTFKFLLQKHNFRPAIVKGNSETELLYNATGDRDEQWNIAAAGNYTIRINIKNNSISITKN
ncbi:MAG: SusF/SusE family outer membrane protein [Tannerella sp.]|nr:SusF/SusE family outer membrane protein [Tannerella sp.]